MRKFCSDLDFPLHFCINIEVQEVLVNTARWAQDLLPDSNEKPEKIRYSRFRQGGEPGTTERQRSHERCRPTTSPSSSRCKPFWPRTPTLAMCASPRTVARYRACGATPSCGTSS